MNGLQPETPKQSDSKRICTKLIRYSPAELRLVVEQALLRGRPVACYIREASLDAAPRARRTHTSDALIYRLGLLATRLTALASVATEQGLPAATELASAVDEVLEFVRQLD